ncbi:single-stranded DNA-binding protein [Mycoplasmopsis pullorum]|uniref:single-stranded DNA-binding protein n=1 Tax=Mycoplasmopsis pullorum TaxID=48003 RepID=UPI00111AB700|nr:single-stranded DNA-binding protein [Mycoplasmopsis pullorum]TNK82524.1 single-stranded DNA-binding protein [Mycoplasmopsis pullorum]TNK82766.1 single-stranded DNA-binding protein [Mycoplasmopsis pullorum]TNK84625.1 single-stranded DNA-binding protein [Mycoplasmopsis pullorum]TNK85335.1 single-stranded DNA-binding protein [Mycoplasmopsis pullorum]TNK86306.1 single-stranded DNA-binding protein [Mycoplasmopsis pullorum]
MNKIILIGRTTSEVRYNHTANGVAYARTTVAVERRNSNTDATDFIPVVAWRGTADFLNAHVRKGTLISIEGALFSNQYESRDGNIVRSYEVSIENVSILEPKSVVENRQPNPGYVPSPAQNRPNVNYTPNLNPQGTTNSQARVGNQIQTPEIKPNFGSVNSNFTQVHQQNKVVPPMNDFHSLDDDTFNSLNSSNNNTPNVANNDNESSFMFDLDNIDKLD